MELKQIQLTRSELGGGLSEAQSDAADTKRVALNGAQVNALIGVIQNVKDGVLNNDQAKNLLSTSFGLSDDEAQGLLVTY